MDSPVSLAENGHARSFNKSNKVSIERFQKVKKMIWGPFLFIAYLTGQFIPADTKNTSRFKIYLHLVPNLVPTLILLARAIYTFVLMMSATTLSINWTYSTVLFFMALHGFSSSAIIAGFKFKNYIQKTTELIITATRNELTIPTSYLAPRWLISYISWTIMLAGPAVYCVDNYVLYDDYVVNLENNGFTSDIQSFRKSMFQHRFLLPLDTVIIMWGAVISACALFMYACANTAMVTEYGVFNKKLRELIDNKQILKYEVAREIENQTIDFLELANHITDSSAGLLSVTFMMSVFMQLCSQFALKEFTAYLKFGFGTFGVWAMLSTIMLIVSVLRPAVLYTMSRDTLDMLYLDHGIWRECPDERIREIMRDTIDRIEKIDYASKTMTSSKSASGIFNIILIVVPFFVIILSAYTSKPENL